MAQAIYEAISEIIIAIQEQMESGIDERMAATGAAPHLHLEFSYKDFFMCSSPLFNESTNPIVCMCLIFDVDGVF